jgi:hypothetical protein
MIKNFPKLFDGEHSKSNTIQISYYYSYHGSNFMSSIDKQPVFANMPQKI